jgi:hypothetical protein
MSFKFHDLPVVFLIVQSFKISPKVTEGTEEEEAILARIVRRVKKKLA